MTDDQMAEIINLLERLKSTRMACRKILAEVKTMLEPIEEEIKRFEESEMRRGNPAALAGRPPAEWGLSPEIEALYVRHWQLAQAIHYGFSELEEWDE